MQHKKFQGKTKTELSYDAFIALGDCTLEQWTNFLATHGCKECSQTMYYATKKQIKELRKTLETNPNISLEAAKKLLKNDSLNLALLDKVKSAVSKPVRPSPATVCPPTTETELRATLRRFRKLTELAEKTGVDTVKELTSLISEVGADAVQEMIAVYQEQKNV